MALKLESCALQPHVDVQMPIANMFQLMKYMLLIVSMEN